MKILKTSFFILLLSFINLVFALDVPQNIVLEKATDNSLELSWDKVQNAGVYAISYGTKTASGGTYEHELEVIVDENAKGNIENLEANTKYYIAVKAYDSNDNESEYSKEVSFNTLKKVKSLNINSIKINDTRNLDINFNVDLDKKSLVNLNIVDLDDKLESLEIEKYSIVDNTLKVFINKDLKINDKYSITIITLKGLNGEIIKSGVDGIFEFVVDKNTKVYTQEKIGNLNSAETTEKNTVEKNTVSGKKEENIKEEINNKKSKKVLGGTNLVNSGSITEKIAKTKKDLPTTGPTETLLFLFFSLISGGLLIGLRKKINA